MTQRKKNQMMALRLLVLTLVSLFLYWTMHEETSPVVNKDIFKPADIGAIDKVVLTNRDHKVELVLQANRWMVNGVYDADADMVKILFETLRKADVRWPVTGSMLDSVTSRLKRTGILVTLSGQGEEIMKFTAAGDRKRNDTWYMKEGGVPYEMIIPGYKVYVAGILELDESGWRNKRIFDFNWRNFKALKAEYRKEPQQGFEVELKGSYFGIKGMEAVDTTKLNNYLDAVSLLFADRFVAKTTLTDSLSAIDPAIHIQINDIANRTYSLDLFTPRKNDPQVYGRLGTGEWVTLPRTSMGPIAWKRVYFVAQE